jgi:uncharacterized protein YkwD
MASTLLVLGAFGAYAAEGRPVAVAGCDGKPVELMASEARLVRLHNEAREAEGLAHLCVEPSLVEAARGHAQDMIDEDYFDHVSPDGGELKDRLKAADYTGYEVAGENIAWGRADSALPEDRFEAWMASDAHRENVLRGSYREIGVGLANGDLAKKEDATVYVVDFGSQGERAPHAYPEVIGAGGGTTGGGTTGGTTDIDPGISTVPIGPEDRPEEPEGTDPGTDPETTAPEPPGVPRPTNDQTFERTQIQTPGGGGGGGIPTGGPGAQEEICARFKETREEVIGDLLRESKEGGLSGSIKGQIADTFQKSFLNPGFCDFGPVGEEEPQGAPHRDDAAAGVL